MTQLREAAGFALLLAGVVGWLLPIIPGTPFLIAGAALLGTDHPMLRPWIQRIRDCRRMRKGEAGDSHVWRDNKDEPTLASRDKHAVARKNRVTTGELVLDALLLTLALGALAGALHLGASPGSLSNPPSPDSAPASVVVLPHSAEGASEVADER